MAYAYYEKIARINLTTGTVTVEKLDTVLAKKFIGGRGLGTKIAYDEGCAAVNPSLMRQYTSGVKTAGEKTYERLSSCIEQIKSELQAASF